MNIAFSTLACPDWSLDRVLETAVALGFDGIELRFVESDDRLWLRPEFTGARLRETVHRLRDAGVRVCCLDTSCFFHYAEESSRQAALEMGRASIGLAAALSAPAIRVFGDRVQPGGDRAGTMKWVAEAIRTLAAYGQSFGVATWLETHGDFSRAADTGAILTEAGLENTGAIWDPLNSFSEFGEEPEAGFGELGPLVRHVHIKDARRGAFPWEPVLVGTGDFPARSLIDLLVRRRYQGFVSFEWEKRWHPQIPPPDVALPHFAQWVRAVRETHV